MLKDVVVSYLSNVDKSIKYDQLEDTTYIKNTHTNEINKIKKYEKDLEFEMMFIMDDVVYINSFKVIHKRKTILLQKYFKGTI